MKHITLLATVAIALNLAAIPQRWTVETSRVQPAQFEGYHGETIEFAATMQTYGTPLAITNDLIGIYWQTNGMGSAYWTAPAVLSNNVMIARFEPSMDVGANVYSCFIGAPGEIYRAAFQLRLRPSPGAVPSELPLPVQAIDFAQIEVRNAPYYTRGETDARIIELAPAPGNYETVSNRAMTAVQPSAISDMETQTHADQTYQPKGSYLTSETDPTVYSAISTHNSSTSAHSDIRTAISGKQDTISDLATIRSGAAAGATALQSYTESDPTVADWAKKPNPAPVTDLSPAISYTTAVSNKLESTKQPTISDLATIRSGAALGATALQSFTETDPTVSSWAKATTKPSYMWTEIGSKPSWIGNSKPSYTWSEIGSKPTIPTDSTVSGWGYIKTESDPTVDGKISTHNSSASSHADIRATVNAWQTYWSGEDVRVTVTNYYGARDLPILYIEQRTNETDEATNHYKVIWRETDRLTPITNSLAGLGLRIDELDDVKADRAWGNYDSQTGSFAPPDTVSVSASNLVLCAGAAYRPIVSGGRELWVLTANAPQSFTVDESDKFRLDGADGEPMIEIVRGDRRTVPATVASVSTATGHFIVTFNVVSDVHPTIEACTDLTERDWQSESSEDFPGSVSWSGSSGAWIADIATDADALFVQGFYELGGSSYLKLMGERYTPGITTESDPVATPRINALSNRVDELEDELGDVASVLDLILGAE